jgi:hypothetical protein
MVISSGINKAYSNLIFYIGRNIKVYDFNGLKIESKEADIILEKFKERYINKNYPERILFINHLNRIDKTIPVEQLREINIPKEKCIFMYHERLKTVYRTNFQQICLYIEQLEPWEDIDCLVFDEKLDWFLGINHNEKILLFNIQSIVRKAKL